ncbi:MAG: histidinol-phosphatase family [Clostridiales bacterium]|nr:histidinol-phosphatase family [Clostridiales bacterium]
MIRTDCHVHSNFSSDSATPIEDMIEEALLRSYNSFYLTDHMDYDFPKNKEGLTFTFSPAEYFDKLAQLECLYKDRISIKRGVELGLGTTPSIQKQIKALLASYSFDLIIGSTHLADGADPYHPSFWEGCSEQEAITHFFLATLENVKANPYIHVLGHLDYALRYAPSKGANFQIADYQNVLDEILRFLIQNEIALEVNTAGYKSLNRPNPDEKLIARYLSLGGSMLSIGSDAHVPTYYSYCFAKTRELLLSLGVTEYTTFEQGKPKKHPL